MDDADAIKRLDGLMRKQGRIVSTIGAADPDWFAERGVTAIDLVVNKTPQSSHAGLRTLLELLQQGRIRVTIAAEHSLSDAVVALDESKNGSSGGKLVITVA